MLIIHLDSTFDHYGIWRTGALLVTFTFHYIVVLFSILPMFII